ncbi:sulfurtransferase TusA family protein [Caldivirga sp. UBA161]|uniref:sulfurtransferase TusA family protein n=1 Tax=Caldivirga sp. UBA161 TaxID=1915569 RepID=UPI0025C2B01B|nr:sulfurtransferase TusA family protein [Caldivirga sp. UBA161]
MEEGNEITIDVRGKVCPVPVLEAAKAARLAKPGQVIKVMATDPAAKQDLINWARVTNNELLSVNENDGVLIVRIRIKGK